MSPGLRNLVAVNLAALALLALASNRAVYSHLGATATVAIDALRADSRAPWGPLSTRREKPTLTTYYEGLLFGGDGIKNALALRHLGFRLPFVGMDPFDGDDSPYSRRVNDLREFRATPSMVVPLEGVVHTFNALGLRDREYPSIPEDDTYRILMLGASNLMARGIPDGRGFEPLLEDLLNQGHSRNWRHFEILNLGYDGYTEVRQLVMIDEKLVFPLRPRLVVFVTHSVHDFWEPRFMSLARQRGFKRLRYPYLVDLADKMRAEWEEGRARGVPKELDRAELTEAEREETLIWVYGELGQRCDEYQVRCLAVGVPIPHDPGDARQLARRMEIIRSTGMPTISLQESFSSHYLVDLQRRPWDEIHLNEAAHEIIARDLLAALLRRDPELHLELGFESPPGEAASLDSFRDASRPPH